MGLEQTGFTGTYASLLSDGTIRVKVEEGTPEAKLRKYELSDGTTGEKWELVYNQVSGLITKVEFTEGKFGETMGITIKDGDDEIAILMSLESNFAEDLMKKLPAMDLTKVVTLKPYSFVDEKGKRKKGISVLQEDKRIDNFFYDTANKKNLYGFPELKDEDFKTFKKKDWKKYFESCREFLQDYNEKNILPKLEAVDFMLGGSEVSADEEVLPDFGS